MMGRYYMGKNVAVISDIHSNYLALKACLDYLENRDIDAYLFLGDYVGEFPGIEQTMSSLHELRAQKQCYFIRGNKEEYQLNGMGTGHPDWDPYPSCIGMLRYAAKHLTKKDMEFFESLPISREVQFEDLPKLMLCHGSPRKVNEKLPQDEAKMEEILYSVDANYILCGHTHKKTEVTYKDVHIWNPGSVGCSIDTPFSYKFMILHEQDGKWCPDFISLPADSEAIIEWMKQEGFYHIAPYWAKMTERLIRNQMGKETYGSVLAKAMQICYEKHGECIWPKVPEECFEQALQELFPSR